MRSIPHSKLQTILFDVATGRSLGKRANQQDYCRVDFVEDGENRSFPDTSVTRRLHNTSGEFWVTLADGMGGHVGGETASKLTCDAFLEHIAAPTDDSEASGSDRLRGALDASTIALADAIRLDENLEGMGATLIGGHIFRNSLSWVSVGDSSLMLWRKGALTKLNDDHSMAPILDELAERGQMTQQEARTHIRRNALRSAVTGYEVELVDLAPEAMPLMAGDWVIFASDGLDTLSLAETDELITRFAAGSAEKLVSALLDAVHDAGHNYQDNTAVIAIKVFENVPPEPQEASAA